jgi:hypothetical protein
MQFFYIIIQFSDNLAITILLRGRGCYAFNIASFLIHQVYPLRFGGWFRLLLLHHFFQLFFGINIEKDAKIFIIDILNYNNFYIISI